MTLIYFMTIFLFLVALAIISLLRICYQIVKDSERQMEEFEEKLKILYGTGSSTVN